MPTFYQFFAALGISKDSALWFWGKAAGTILFLASLGADATQLGIPAGWLKGIQILALWVTYISAQNSASGIEDPVVEPAPPNEKWLSTLESVAPTVLSATSTGHLTPFMVAGMRLAERLPNASSEQKKKFVMNFMQMASQAAVPIPPPTPTAPPPEDVAKAVDAVIQLTNLLHTTSAS